MAFAELSTIPRAAANQTVERLQALGIDARILEGKPFLSKAGDAVHVIVPELDVARARVELARWESEAAQRMSVPLREVRTGLWIGLAAALGTALVLAALGAPLDGLLLWTAPPAVWLASLFAWAFWQRAKMRRRVQPGAVRARKR